MRKWDSKTRAVFSAAITCLALLAFVLFFGMQPFECRVEDCSRIFIGFTVAVYLIVYGCFWFVTRFGNLDSVDHEDQF